MKPKAPSPQKQGHLLYQDLIEQLNPKTPLLLLAKKIPWETLEREFLPLYSELGRPAKPIRLMVGPLLLKQIENLSDERVVETWVQNPYYQAFCGMEHFQWKFPCDPTDLVHFRKRIGEACQSALNFDPPCASKSDPPWGLLFQGTRLFFEGGKRGVA